MTLRETESVLALVAEIESMRQQLAEAQADRDAIKKEWEKAYEIGMLAKQQLTAANVLIAEQNKLAKERQEWALHTNEVIRSLNQQLAAALAACKLKDEELENCEGMIDELRDYPITHDAIIEALAIRPDDSALKAWLGEPVTKVIHYDEVGMPHTIHLNVHLYAPKGLP